MGSLSCRPLRGLGIVYSVVPGAHAPGFTLTPAPQASRAYATASFQTNTRVTQLFYQARRKVRAGGGREVDSVGAVIGVYTLEVQVGELLRLSPENGDEFVRPHIARVFSPLVFSEFAFS